MMILFLLIAGHFLCDYPLQGEFLAKGKDHNNSGFIPWWHCLTAHAFIQGGMVAIVTGNLYLGLSETILHWVIDFGKSAKWYGINVDQALHIACKVAWFCIIINNIFN